MCNLKHVNESVPISKPMQSRKDKIKSQDITERFLFCLFDSSVMTQTVERMYTVTLFYFNSFGLVLTYLVTTPNAFCI